MDRFSDLFKERVSTPVGGFGGLAVVIAGLIGVPAWLAPWLPLAFAACVALAVRPFFDLLGKRIEHWLGWTAPTLLAAPRVVYRATMELGEIACFAAGVEPRLNITSGLELQLYRILRDAANDGRLEMVTTEGRGRFGEQSQTAADKLLEFIERHRNYPTQLLTFARNWLANPQPRHYSLKPEPGVFNLAGQNVNLVHDRPMNEVRENSLHDALEIKFEPKEPFLRRHVFPAGNARFEAYVRIENHGDGFVTECSVNIVSINPRPEKNVYSPLAPMFSLAKGEHRYLFVAGFNEVPDPSGPQVYNSLLTFAFASGGYYGGGPPCLPPPTFDAPAFITIEAKALNCGTRTKRFKLWIGDNRRLMMAEA